MKNEVNFLARKWEILIQYLYPYESKELNLIWSLIFVIEHHAIAIQEGF